MCLCVNQYPQKKAVSAKMEFKTSLTVNCTEFLLTSRFISRSLNFILSNSHLLAIIWLCLSVGLGIQYLIPGKQFCHSTAEIKTQSPDFGSKAKLTQFYSSRIALIHRQDSKAANAFSKEKGRIRRLSQQTPATLQPCRRLQLSKQAQRGARQREGAASGWAAGPHPGETRLLPLRCHVWLADEGWSHVSLVNLTSPMGEEAGKARGLQRRIYRLFKDKQDLGSLASGMSTWRAPLCVLNREHLGQDPSWSWILQLSTQWVRKEGLAGSPTQGWLGRYTASCFALILC